MKNFLFLAWTILAATAVAGPRAKATDVYGRVNRSLVVLKGAKGAGSGFIMKEDGETWLYTNEHVLRCGEPITMHFADGRPLIITGGVEVAENRDMARARVSAALPALSACVAAPMLDDPVYVFGNSDGGGVVTKIEGKVLGVGDDRIEVDAKYVQGNSGSAILNERGEVLAIASSALLNDEPEDWVKKETRFNEVRRFGERFNGIRWKPIDWNRYERACRALDAVLAYRDFLIPVCFKVRLGEEPINTSYDKKEASAFRSIGILDASVQAIFRQDLVYLKAKKDLDALFELRKKLREGDMRYPKKENIRIRERKLEKELKKCLDARKRALKNAATALRSYSWPCARLRQDAEALAAGFKYCSEKYNVSVKSRAD